MALSLLRGQRWLFVVLAVLFVVLVVWVVAKKIIHRPVELWCVAAITGGAVGNLIDRVQTGLVVDMLIAGALAGFGAGLFYLSGGAQWIPGDSTALPSEGFDGISVALLASSNPIGAIFSALFISHITTGGGFMNASLFPPEIADIISGIIIYLCAFSLLFRSAIMQDEVALLTSELDAANDQLSQQKDQIETLQATINKAESTVNQTQYDM